MIFISLGSNIGNRLQNILDALRLIKEQIFCELQCSIILETSAILPDGAPQKWDMPFLNAVAYSNHHNQFTPEELLYKLKHIERQMGRGGKYDKWSPRIIDLDILLWDNNSVNTPNVVIPHPELLNRPFLVHLIAIVAPFTCYPQFTSQNENTDFGKTNVSKFAGKNFDYIASNIVQVKECFLRSFATKPQMVGIINITRDSFSDGGMYIHPIDAVRRAEQLVSDGAVMVEFGAQSTRMGAQLITDEEELRRLVPVLDMLKDKIDNDMINVCVDTFSPKVIAILLKMYKIHCINDQSGNLPQNILEEVAAANCKIVAMHSLTLPAIRDNDDTILARYDMCDDIVQVVKTWAKEKIDHLLRSGFKMEDIIIDPGIGFSKSRYQSLQLLKCAKAFKNLECQIMYGHSRKSYITSFSHTSIQNRDVETAVISSQLAMDNVDFLRVHNVQIHQKILSAQQIMCKK